MLFYSWDIFFCFSFQSWFLSLLYHIVDLLHVQGYKFVKRTKVQTPPVVNELNELELLRLDIVILYEVNIPGLDIVLNNIRYEMRTIL